MPSKAAMPWEAETPEAAVVELVPEAAVVVLVAATTHTSCLAATTHSSCFARVADLARGVEAR